MKKMIVIIAILLGGGLCTQAQQQKSSFQEMLDQIETEMKSPKTQEINEETATDSLSQKEKIPAVWKIGSINSLNFSQMSLSNWAAGGQGSIALNAYSDWSAKLSKGPHLWENRFQIAYGFIHAFGDQSKKSDDKLILDSKWGYQAFENLFLSVAFNFTSQMAPGFDYSKIDDPKRISNFMAPGYFSLGLGLDYKPYPFISVSASPLTSKLVVVTDSLLRTRYGNRPGEAARVELGAQVKLDLKKEVFTNVTISTDLTFFSNYLRNPGNIKVRWNLLVDMKVNKYLSANFRMNMIYDDEIKITDSNGKIGPRLQIKEVLGVGLTYSFGQK
jgi:hypothetical protein